MRKLIIINGPNLNLLGVREKSVYGSETLKDLEKYILNKCETLNICVDFFQSNHEGDIIDTIHNSMDLYDGIVINPGAYTHYSYAIHDAIKSINIPVVEVHISNIHGREDFRSKSVTAKACIGQICGFGFSGYVLSIHAILEKCRGILI